jgi:hypothetical protein
MRAEPIGRDASRQPDMGRNAGVPDAAQRLLAVRRRAGTQSRAWTPDQRRTTPQGRRAAQHPGNGVMQLTQNRNHPLAALTLEKRLRMRSRSESQTSR